MSLASLKVMSAEESLDRLLGGGGLRSLFQPLIDLRSGSVWGHEILSRGEGALSSAGALFSAARASDRLFETEVACLCNGLDLIGRRFPGQGGRFFLNVSPSVLLSPRFCRALSADVIHSFGLAPEQIVFELTEREAITEVPAFDEAIRSLRRQGFRLALDDMGAGHSGLKTLMICLPEYIKLDMSLVRSIEKDANRQHLIRFLTDFSSQINAQVIAEGVESWEELKTLIRLGVPLAQGFLLGLPDEKPRGLAPSLQDRLRTLAVAADPGTAFSEPVARLAVRGRTLVRGEAKGEDVNDLFRRDPTLDHIVLLDEEFPCGLITGHAFFQKMGGAFGFHLYRREPAETLSKRDPLVLPGTLPICRASKLAMEREASSLYDPVLVVDDDGLFVGTVTMKQIVTHSLRLEIAEARNCNPLSGLPGNRNIEAWIEEAQSGDEPFTILYVDLDRFKEYNDRYGFLEGDRLIRFSSELLLESLQCLDRKGRLGHLGGDDFVALIPSLLSPSFLEGICRSFEEGKGGFFSDEDRHRGSYLAQNRSGESAWVPLVTMSLAALENPAPSEKRLHPGRLAELAADLKRRAKSLSARNRSSAFLVERLQRF